MTANHVEHEIATRRWRTECLIQVVRLDKLLADQVILPRQFAVAGRPGCADPRGATEADGALFRPRP
jgi:hypothetical protein